MATVTTAPRRSFTTHDSSLQLQPPDYESNTRWAVMADRISSEDERGVGHRILGTDGRRESLWDNISLDGDLSCLLAPHERNTADSAEPCRCEPGQEARGDDTATTRVVTTQESSCIDTGPTGLTRKASLKLRTITEDAPLLAEKKTESSAPRLDEAMMVGLVGRERDVAADIHSLPSVPPEELYVIKNSISALVTSLKTQARLVENLADHYVIPMRRRHKKGTHVTLAEMARCMRIDRLLEVLEGAVWLEKKVVGWGETTGQEFNATQVQVMMTAVGGIRKASDALEVLLLGKKTPTLTESFGFHSGKSMEKFISRLHDSIEELLLYLKSALKAWVEHKRGDRARTRADLLQNLQKIELLLSMLPQKYTH